MTDVNDSLPDVTVADSAGNAVNLAALQGPLVLYFYPKADTPGCTNEAKDFTTLASDFAALGCSGLRHVQRQARQACEIRG